MTLSSWVERAWQVCRGVIEQRMIRQLMDWLENLTGRSALTAVTWLHNWGQQSSTDIGDSLLVTVCSLEASTEPDNWGEAKTSGHAKQMDHRSLWGRQQQHLSVGNPETGPEVPLKRHCIALTQKPAALLRKAHQKETEARWNTSTNTKRLKLSPPLSCHLGKEAIAKRMSSRNIYSTETDLYRNKRDIFTISRLGQPLYLCWVRILEEDDHRKIKMCPFIHLFTL